MIIDAGGVMKEMNLPFNTALGENVENDLVTTLSVGTQVDQPCVMCMAKNKKGDERWMLEIEAHAGDFSDLAIRVYCPDCGDKRVRYYNRRKECELEAGSPRPGTLMSKQADRCVGEKKRQEGE